MVFRVAASMRGTRTGGPGERVTVALDSTVYRSKIQKWIIGVYRAT